MKKSSSRNSFCYPFFVKNTLEWKFLPDMEKWRVFVGNKFHNRSIDLETLKKRKYKPKPSIDTCGLCRDAHVFPEPHICERIYQQIDAFVF